MVNKKKRISWKEFLLCVGILIALGYGWFCLLFAIDRHNQIERPTKIATLKAEYQLLTSRTWRVAAFDPGWSEYREMNNARLVLRRTDDDRVERVALLHNGMETFSDYKGLIVGDIIRLKSRREWDESQEDKISSNLNLWNYLVPVRQ